MDSDGNLLDSAVPKNLKSQTDISTGIGPTGTDTPAPKDIMPHTDNLVCLLVHSLKLDLVLAASQMLPFPISVLDNSVDSWL
jgi:hypothetical protein